MPKIIKKEETIKAEPVTEEKEPEQEEEKEEEIKTQVVSDTQLIYLRLNSIEAKLDEILKEAKN